ncbi:MAG: hypothetical protein ACK5HR_03985 [Mycoplasmatales bacterium]
MVQKFYSNYKRYEADKISIVLNKQGPNISKYKVLKSMKRQGLLCLYNKLKKYKKYDYNKADIPNIVNRKFNQPAIITSDLTYIRLGNRFYYLCFIVDSKTREIISYSFILNSNRNIKLGKYSVFHANRGSEFVNFDVGNVLKYNNITRFLSASVHPYNNTVSKNIFNLFKR